MASKVDSTMSSLLAPGPEVEDRRSAAVVHVEDGEGLDEGSVWVYCISGLCVSLQECRACWERMWTVGRRGRRYDQAQAACLLKAMSHSSVSLALRSCLTLHSIRGTGLLSDRFYRSLLTFNKLKLSTP